MENLSKTQLAGGTGAVLLGTLGTSVIGGGVGTTIAGIAGIISGITGEEKIENEKAKEIMNGLKNFSIAVTATGLGWLLIQSNLFFHALAALGIVLVGTKVYYTGKQTAEKVIQTLGKKEPKKEHTEDIEKKEVSVDANENHIDKDLNGESHLPSTNNFYIIKV